MDTRKQQQNFAENSKSGERQDHLPNPKAVDTPNRKATEQLLRQIFTRQMEGTESSNDELTQEVSRAFQLFRSDYPDLLGPKRNTEKESKIRERISNLQKRTSDTLQVLTNCKEDVSSVVFLDTKPQRSDDIDESMISDTRSLGELIEEISKTQSREPSNSVTAIQRPDIEEMKNATDQLLNSLGRISKNYTSEKNKTS